MKKISRFLLLPLFFLGMTGCTTTIALKPVPEAGQKVVYEHGHAITISTGKSKVAIAPITNTYNYPNQRPTFRVFVKNTTDKDFLFSTDNITAQSQHVGLKVLSYEEITDEVKSRARAAAVAMAFSGAVSAASAAQLAGNNYYSGSVYGSRGYANYYGNSYNGAAAYAAANNESAKAAMGMNSIARNSNIVLTGLNQQYVQAQTIMPGAQYSGNFTVLSPDLQSNMSELILQVTLPGEVHQFKYALQKVN